MIISLPVPRIPLAKAGQEGNSSLPKIAMARAAAMAWK